MRNTKVRRFPKYIGIVSLLIGFFAVFSCSKAEDVSSKRSQTGAMVVAGEKQEKRTVTFIELGSVNCIPCKAMRPIMRDIEIRYGEQVKVIFYDVWTKEGQPYGSVYRIRVIPTQVFLDSNGVEYFRHEGYFPKEELLKILEKGGVKL